jgi:hypothetical protein
MPFIPRTVIQTSTDGEAWDDLVPGVLGKGSLVAVDLTVALSQQLDRLAASGPGVPLGALIGPADVGQEGNLVERIRVTVVQRVLAPQHLLTPDEPAIGFVLFTLAEASQYVGVTPGSLASEHGWPPLGAIRQAMMASTSGYDTASLDAIDAAISGQPDSDWTAAASKRLFSNLMRTMPRPSYLPVETAEVSRFEPAPDDGNETGIGDWICHLVMGCSEQQDPPPPPEHS